MVMPPHVTGPAEDGIPLSANVFVISGYTLSASDFRVVDATTGEPCQVKVELERTQQIAARWKEHFRIIVGLPKDARTDYLFEPCELRRVLDSRCARFADGLKSPYEEKILG